MIQSSYMQNWDYDIKKDWKPTNDYQWEWLLVRKLNYGDFAGIEKPVLKKYFPNIKKQLDPGVRLMLEHFLML